jgi:hypothetical protein
LKFLTTELWFAIDPLGHTPDTLACQFESSRSVVRTWFAAGEQLAGRTGTTLNTYAHVIPDSQRRAVEQVAGVLFSNVLELDDGAKNGRIN